jgi:hypothetical protein
LNLLAVNDRRAVGGPVALPLLAAYFGAALLAWIAAAVVAIFAVADLAAGNPLGAAPVLAVHLVALGALPLAVSGASFHLLPVMLRNDLPSQRALWVALPLLGCGVLVGAGIAADVDAIVWLGAVSVTCGLAIVLWEILTLVAHAPSGRVLIASRAGVALACFHVVAALGLGAAIFSEDRPFAGLAYERWLLIHLHVALLGWIALLVITVGRNLGPMLALAPAAPKRTRPVDELALVAALWLLLAGIGTRERALTLIGGAAIVVTLGRFVLLLARIARMRRGALEGPLAHLLAGGAFLVQAAALGLAVAAGAGGTRLVCAYVIFVLVGWAGGVVIGHVPKLLSLSRWVWWPPGPRPKQGALYRRRLGNVEAIVFALGVEALAIGIAVGNVPLARTGAALFLVSAILAAAGLPPQREVTLRSALARNIA